MSVRRLAPLLALLLLGASQTARASISYSPPFPTGNVGYTKPLIGIRLTLTDGDEAQRAVITVDDVPCEAMRFGELLACTPVSPLSPGPHTVSLMVDFGANWRPLAPDPWQFTVVSGALNRLPPVGLENLAVGNEINRLRQEADLFPLHPDPMLIAAAEHHARYYINNPVEGLAAHEEQPGRLGFTGVHTGDRGRFFGYPFSRYYEDMHFLTNHTRAVKDWRDSVYHRFPLLDPAVQHFGYGYDTDRGESVNVLNIASRDVQSPPGPGTAPGGPALAVYPAPGQRGIPIKWDGRETPDPYRLFPGAKPAGYPITVQFSDFQVTGATVTNTSLTTDDGMNVPFWLLHAGNDTQIQYNIALLPKADLQYGRRYVVSVAGTVTLRNGNTRPFSVRWWFTTAGSPEQALTGAVDVLLDGRSIGRGGIMSGRTMLPFRALFESLGARVDWDPDFQRVRATVGTRTVHLKINNDRALVNDQEVLLEAAPTIVNARTLVPVRLGAEALGLTVNWDSQTRTVNLTSHISPDAPKTPIPARDQAPILPAMPAISPKP